MIFAGYSLSSTNKTDPHDIAEILMKVALNIIALILTLSYISFKSLSSDLLVE